MAAERAKTRLPGTGVRRQLGVEAVVHVRGQSLIAALEAHHYC
ncbi:hypothetical protein ES332_D06G129500v1 [Gossypium tomentosum]|uniref:Uncharacterized protein n=1 Tax=Gossypium tomentosum TaxID=34277 RepID=A0A5D2KH78_GOSTO|nr:hypothetical protein ES332_D06G129500v1 [Gossypium tomentosum]